MDPLTALHASLPPEDRAVIKARQGVELITSGELKVVPTRVKGWRTTAVRSARSWCAANVVMKGYYRDPDATAAVIRDGWFHTGDAAVVHPARSGYVRPGPKPGTRSL